MKLAKAMEEGRLGCENRSATVIVVISHKDSKNDSSFETGLPNKPSVNTINSTPFCSISPIQLSE